MEANSGNPKLPFVTEIGDRRGSLATDEYLQNFTAEQAQDGSVRILKRPGIGVPTVDAGVTGTGLGTYFWNGNLYTVTSDGNLRRGQSTTIGAVDTSGVYDWNETLGTPFYLFLKDSIAAYSLTSGGAFAQVVDPNYPAVTVPGSAYLDGTLYVMDSQGRIWGSAGLNNPTVWSALNLIRAQVEPDLGIALAKQAIYVVAFKQWTTEFFYDAGNPTGSPLLPVQNAKLPFGCYLGGRSVCSINDELYFIGTNRAIGLGIYKISKLQITKISTPAVDRLLESNVSVSPAFSTRAGGHVYYILPLAAGVGSLVFDTTVGVWQVWKQNGATLDIVAATSNMTLSFFLQAQTNGAVIQNPNAYTGLDYTAAGAQVPMVAEACTPPFDGGTRLEKVLTRLFIEADQQSSGPLEMCWSDDDYRTWSEWRAVSLADDIPQFQDLGTFRKRAFKFRHSSPSFIRLVQAEMELLACGV